MVGRWDRVAREDGRDGAAACLLACSRAGAAAGRGSLAAAGEVGTA